jgi:hypothetical protein
MAWKHLGGMDCGGEPFDVFFLRSCRVIRLAMTSHNGDGLADRVANMFKLLGGRKLLAELDRPLLGGFGQSSQQVFPLPPLSVDGRFLREGAVESREDEIDFHGGNLLLAVLNWMHGEEADGASSATHLSSAHRRVHARIARTLRAMVMTSEPTLTRGGLDQFLRLWGCFTFGSSWRGS